LRLAILCACLLAAVVVYMFSGSATLNFSCRHKFRHAELSIWVDGKPAYSGEMNGGVKKRFGLLGRVEGSFKDSMGISAGEHVIQVRVKSVAEGYDQTRRTTANIGEGKENTLLISAERSDLSLTWQRANAQPEPAPASYWRYLSSILMTMGGSAVSAAIGFFIQEFLRARKTPPAPASLDAQTSKILS
jgi:hypothetical protein